MVILLVETQHLMTDICETSPSIASKLADPVAFGAPSATLRHPPFAVGPVHSPTDDEAEAQRSCGLQSQGEHEQRLEKIIPKVKQSQVYPSG